MNITLQVYMESSLGEISLRCLLPDGMTDRQVQILTTD